MDNIRRILAQDTFREMAQEFFDSYGEDLFYIGLIIGFMIAVAG